MSLTLAHQFLTFGKQTSSLSIIIQKITHLRFKSIDSHDTKEK